MVQRIKLFIKKNVRALSKKRLVSKNGSNKNFLLSDHQKNLILAFLKKYSKNDIHSDSLYSLITIILLSNKCVWRETPS